MSGNYLEDDLAEEDWDYDFLIADAAGEIAEEAQQCNNSEPGGLLRAFRNTINSVKLFELSTFIKTASIEEQSGAVSTTRDVFAQTLGQQATTQNTAQNIKSFARQLTLDPMSSSNQAAIKTVTDCLSLRDTSSNDISQPSEEPENRRSAKRLELEKYSESVTTALHKTFHTSAYLPCTCLGKGGAVCLSEEYVCALRLDGYQQVPGDDNHCFFDSVVAYKGDESHEWTPVQFQLPRETRGSEDPEDATNEPSTHKTSLTALDDFCKILTWNIRCFRIHVTKNLVSKSLETHSFCWSPEASFSNIFPPRGAPMLLSTALKQDELSARHKIFLAFTIAKAFWQYYDSDWMNVEWSLETIQLLQKTSSPDSEAPFLKIQSAESEDSTNHEHEPIEISSGAPYLHPFPYIFNLGLLLVQLGSITSDKPSITGNATHLTGALKSNGLYVSCCEISADIAWPTIELPAKAKPRYRRIVEECIPTQPEVPRPLFEKHLDAVGRRLALKNHVVRPLFELFQDMADPGERAFEPPKMSRSNEPSVLQTEDSVNKAPKTPRCEIPSHAGVLSWDWLNNITNSWLHSHVSDRIKDLKRPKIAIIDTGFDGGSRFADRKLKQRLNMLSASETGNYNWKDYWKSETVPQDNEGHGTAMLSIIHRIAPFADICVARIAGKDADLKEDPKTTSNNLAKAILWAVEEQDADIVSLSLGWEQEQRVDENRVISNAISKALSHRNQNLLIFAAASNLGGSKRELFPAKHPTVFSIRGTNSTGKHEDFNPSLPEREGEVFGTLGLEVPASNRGKLEPQYINRTGTSAATAVAAAIAAIVVAYVNIYDEKGSWDNIRMFEGFQNLLYELSTEPEARKRYITLDNHSKEEHRVNFEIALSGASNLKQGK
ncbi:subtilisin-like protein [Lophium mytilinum]|uniref:Subtilisin-like protein n=1 Tax=Lophium mytilinum TaxID=390894 RepID=A0A6A6QZ99_9PEZI|nr:subtilisin-like protein [Lophium mytilinum]